MRFRLITKNRRKKPSIIIEDSRQWILKIILLYNKESKPLKSQAMWVRFKRLCFASIDLILCQSIGQIPYKEDWEAEKQQVYYPVHITPEYEASSDVKKVQSDVSCYIILVLLLLLLFVCLIFWHKISAKFEFWSLSHAIIEDHHFDVYYHCSDFSIFFKNITFWHG